MAIPAKTKKYLEKRLAKYEPLAHRTVYTAYDTAQTLRRELKDIAKSLVVAADKAYIIVVVPAHMKIDLKKLKSALKAKKVSIPDEKVLVKIFKTKASVTAFGGLHKIEVLADKSLLKTKDAIFSAGNFTDSIRMKVKDFLEMEQARLAAFTKSGGYKKPKVVKAKPKKKTTKKKVAKRPAKKIVKKSTAKKKTTAKKKR